MDHNIQNSRVEAHKQNDSVNKVSAEGGHLLSSAKHQITAHGPNTGDAHVPNLTITGDASGAHTHKVTGKDNLWKISEGELKAQHAAHSGKDIQHMVDRIVQANKDHYSSLVKNPHSINESMTLVIPPIHDGKSPVKDSSKSEQPKGAEDKAKVEPKPIEGKEPGKVEQKPAENKDAKPGKTEEKPVESKGTKPSKIEQKPAESKEQKPEAKAENTEKHPAAEHHGHGRGHGHGRHSHGRHGRGDSGHGAKEHSDGERTPKANDGKETDKKGADKPAATGDSHHVNASWYNEGHRVATGARYNPMGITVASKELPLGSKIEITNPHNGKSVIATVNDRGPYVKGRSLDLSEGTARALSDKNSNIISRGVIDVTYRRV